MVQVTGKPSPEGMAKVYEAVLRWMEEGCKTYTCQECRATLKAEEIEDGFCARHNVSRHVYTLEEALRDGARSSARSAKRLQNKAVRA